MKIERVDPHHKTVKIADGTPSFDYFADGHIEIFIPTDGGGGDGHVITITREEAERLE